MNSETAKHRHLVLEYCQGNTLDLGSSGEPVVPWAIQVELPREKYIEYNKTRPDADIQWRGSALDLPFKDRVVDTIHTAHLLEDFADWGPPLKEWDRVLKVGGYMIIAVPDAVRFRSRVARGLNGENASHRHEAEIGELSRYLHTYEVIRDGFVSDDPEEYSILFIGRKREV